MAGDKHEEVMARMGGIMALGILDAGGRNTVVGLRSQSGFYRRTSCIGMMIFTQYWFWYPLSYFLSLALQPTAFIGVNKDLDLPSMEVGSNNPNPEPLTHSSLVAFAWTIDPSPNLGHSPLSYLFDLI